MNYQTLKKAMETPEYRNACKTEAENLRYYIGKQWGQEKLPHPVLNYFKRIADHLSASAVKNELHLSYRDPGYAFRPSEERKRQREMLVAFARAKWETDGMDAVLRDAVLSCLLTGTGFLYTGWQDGKKTGCELTGDTETVVLRPSQVLVDNPTEAKPEAQDWIAFPCHEKAERVKQKMRGWFSPTELRKITPDEGEGVCLFFRLLYKKEGKVMIRYLFRETETREMSMGLYHYPLVRFTWGQDWNGFYGISPMSQVTENQRYINLAYAMAMKHMKDTAFSKILYDRTRIGEWTKDIGEAIAVSGGGAVEDAVKVVGVGELQAGYLDLIDSVIDHTKSMMGAVDVSMGEGAPTNTSAIEALQTASDQSLSQAREHIYSAVGDLLTVYQDYILSGYYLGRRVLTQRESGLLAERLELLAERVDYIGVCT